ncbi:mas-related G-protein coupled receptor member X1-like [Gracilinanus agilis]|uniref:mas-related G-protein coupled receptor member X1-like n=1 Tax=Gracilinanus agilis TaxID=191870 RepID=UPI001CFEFB3A|nr:mas-related G-protein coupled receptor member X1-like [Gracilinanus agilis]
MASMPTPGEREYLQDKAMERSANQSAIPGVFGEYYGLATWTRSLHLVISLLGLLGNSIILWLLGFRTRRNPFSVYILNLAGADALYLLGRFVFSMERLISHVDYVILIAVFYFTTISYSVSLSLLAAISTERCLAAFFPVWYRCHRPKHASAIVCTALWVLPVLFWGAEMILCAFVYYLRFCFSVKIVQVVWFIHFSPVLGGTSLSLVLRVQCCSQRRQPPTLYLLVLLLVLGFLLCGLPLGIEDVLWRLGFDFKPLWLPSLLACVNSSLKPLIYFFLGSQRHRRGREPLRVVLQRALADEHELDRMKDTPPHQLSGDALLRLRTRSSDWEPVKREPLPRAEAPSYFPESSSQNPAPPLMLVPRV